MEEGQEKKEETIQEIKEQILINQTEEPQIVENINIIEENNIPNNKEINYIELIKDLQKEIEQLKLSLIQNNKNLEISQLKQEIENLKSIQENNTKEITALKAEIEKLKQAQPTPNTNTTNTTAAEVKKPVQEEEQLSELEQFKRKYNIKENCSEIEIFNKHIGDKGVELLFQIPQNKIKTLNLYGNDIKNILFLTKINSEKLERLYLYNNKITDISILGDINLSNLLELCLDNNPFGNISILEKMNCNKLKKLYLSASKISDISVLERVNFPELEKLDLSNNHIKDISVFERKKFDKLILLNISENKVDYNTHKNKSIVRELKKIIEEFEH